MLGAHSFPCSTVFVARGVAETTLPNDRLLSLPNPSMLFAHLDTKGAGDDLEILLLESEFEFPRRLFVGN